MKQILLLGLVLIFMSSIVYSAVLSDLADVNTYYDFAQTAGNALDRVAGNDSISDTIGDKSSAGINGNAWDLTTAGDNLRIPPLTMQGQATGTYLGWFKMSTTQNFAMFHGSDDAVNPGVRTRLLTEPDTYLQLKTSVTQVGGDFSTIEPSADGNWHQFGWTYDGTFMYGIYDGVRFDGAKIGITGTIDVPAVISIGKSHADASYQLKGQIDEIAIWNRVLTADEIALIYNSGTGTFYDDWIPTPPPPVPSYFVNITFPPENDTFGFDEFVGFGSRIYVNGTHTGNQTLNCTINDTRWNLTEDTSTTFSFLSGIGAITESGDYSISVTCFNLTNTSINGTGTTFFFLDNEMPTLNTSFINHSMHYLNFTGQMNFSDNDLVHSINISINGVQIFGMTHIHSKIFIYNLSQNITNLTLGANFLTTIWADGHTSNKLKHDYKESTGFFGDYMKYEFFEGGGVKTKNKDSSIFDDWESIKKIDRYIQIYKPANPRETQVFIEETDDKIYIYKKRGKYKGEWIVFGKHWKDYVLKDEPDSKVKIKLLDDYTAEITITDITNNPNRLEFQSLGDLNIEERNYTFYNINITETFDAIILDDTNFSLSFKADYGTGLLFDTSNKNISIILEFNATNYTGTILTDNETESTAIVKFEGLDISKPELLDHRWYFNYTPFLDPSIITLEQTQVLTTVEVGKCAGNITFPIINFSYFDELTDEAITATNAYNLKLFDGTFFYNQTDSFLGSTNDTLCTNLNDSQIVYNWNAWGTITLSKSQYITRVLDFEEVVPIALSNLPTKQLNLFLIGTANSSTIRYQWLTSEFKFIDGTMRIFKCDPDGTFDLVESTPLITGLASANLQLLTQPYFYDIIIDGVIFQDFNSYSRCHIESDTITAIKYFVEVSFVDVAAVI